MTAGFFIERLLAYRLDVYILMFLLFMVTPRAGEGPGPLIFVLASCFTAIMAFVYLINKTTDTQEDGINHSAGPIARSSIPLVQVGAWTLGILGFLVLALLTLNPAFLVLYAVVALLGVLYSYPLTVFGWTRRCKQIPIIKTSISTLIWILPPVASYMIYLGEIRPREVWLLVLFGGLFAAMEICWDIRDVRGDAQSDVRTIPVVFGVMAAKVIALLLIALATFAGYMLSLNVFSVLGIIASISVILIAREGRPWWLYHAIVVAWILLLALYYVQ